MDDVANTKKRKKRKKRRIILISVFSVFAILIASSFIYLGIYQKGDETCDAALESDTTVQVQQEENGYFFDGPSQDNLILFYPGAKVDTKAYAPLLRQVAKQDADVYLFSMPFHMAFFGLNRANEVRKNNTYQHYYMAGHSLGAAMAGVYVADHLDEYDGLIFLAGYPTKDLHHDGFSLLSIYGSNDMNVASMQKNPQYRPDDYHEVVIAGGNHANFGNYGEQKGDGVATISREEQQTETVTAISAFLDAKSKNAI